MAQENNSKIILTAEDRTGPALASVTRGLSGMQAEALRAGSALGAIGFTAAAAATVAFVRSVTNAADEFQKMSQRLGISARELAGWQLAADLSGASVEAISKGVKGLATYVSQYGDKLKALGIDTSDANVAFMQLADLFAELPDGLEKSALATQLFGKAGQDLIPLLNQGSAGVAAMREKAAGYGETLERIGPDAEKFNDQMHELGFQAKAAGAKIAAHFMPGLAGLATWLNDVVAGGDRARGALEWIGGLREGALGRSQGYRGPKNALGLPATAEEVAAMSKSGSRTAAQDAAVRRAQSLMTTGGSGGGNSGRGKAPRVFDPEGDTLFAIEEANRKAIRSEQMLIDKEEEAFEKRRLAMEQMAERRMEETRLATEGEEAVREYLEKTTHAIEKQNDTARELGFTFASAAEEAILHWEGVGKLLQGISHDVARIFVRKTVTEPLGNSLAGAFDKMGGGSGLLKSVKNLFSFDGGGSTGSGPRSGGLDGKGGFMAMLHPNETVIDHTKGGGGNSVTIYQTISIDSRSDQSVIAAAMVQAKNAAVAEVHNAMRRGAWA